MGGLGAILEPKNTINTTLDQLSFAAGAAEAEGVSGT